MSDNTRPLHRAVSPRMCVMLAISSVTALVLHMYPLAIFFLAPMMVPESFGLGSNEKTYRFDTKLCCITYWIVSITRMILLQKYTSNLLSL